MAGTMMMALLLVEMMMRGMVEPSGECSIFFQCFLFHAVAHIHLFSAASIRYCFVPFIHHINNNTTNSSGFPGLAVNI